MRHARLILSLIAGSLLAVAVYLWPTGPHWKIKEVSGHTLESLTDHALWTIRRLSQFDVENNNVCCCWDLQSGRLHQTITIPRSVFDEAGKSRRGSVGTAVAIPQSIAVTPLDDQSKIFLGYTWFSFAGHVYDVATGQTLFQIFQSDLDTGLRSPLFSPNGDYLALVSYHPTRSNEKTILVLNTKTGKIQSQISAPPGRISTTHASACFSDDSSKLAVISERNGEPSTLIIYCMKTHRTIASWPLPNLIWNSLVSWNNSILTCSILKPQIPGSTTSFVPENFVELKLPEAIDCDLVVNEITLGSKQLSAVGVGYLQETNYPTKPTFIDRYEWLKSPVYWLENNTGLSILPRPSIQLYDRVTRLPKGPAIPLCVNHLISPSGSWIATSDENGHIALWNTTPSPRIWSPLLTGLLAALLFWKCPLRFRRKQSPPSLTASI